MSARNQVELLLSIIREAALDALDEYEKTGQAAPTLDSLNKHPLDDAENKLGLKKIISKLEGACEQLCTTLSSPTHTIMNRAQDYGWACLQVAVRQKVADELAKHPDGLHVDVLSDRVQIHSMKLASILRVLAAKHCFREVAPDVFANNRLSLTLASVHPMSALVNLIMDSQKSALGLCDYLVDPHFGQSLSMTKAAFQFSNGGQSMAEGITYYDWLQLSEQQERRKIFTKAMISMNEVIGSLSVLYVYPWSRSRTVCDVGSGTGAFSRSLLEMFPHINVVLFDLPNTIALAKQHWKDDFTGRVTLVEGDFFKEVPVQNDVYYLRSILHNWTDEKALGILQNVRASMGPQSRLLVHDHVLRHMSPQSELDTEKLDKAPEPLLPNYGAGHIRLYHQDMTMMMIYNAKERTTTEMTKIAERANLRLLTVFDLGEMCLLEFGITEV